MTRCVIRCCVVLWCVFSGGTVTQRGSQMDTTGLNPRLAETVRRLASDRTAAGLRVAITRPDGSSWDGYFRNIAERDEFIARAARLGLVATVVR